MFILLIFYTLSQFFVGRLLFRKLFDEAPKLLEIVGSFLLGTFVSVPITYVFACLFAFTGEPMLFSTIIVSFASYGLAGYLTSPRLRGASGLWNGRFRVSGLRVTGLYKKLVTRHSQLGNNFLSNIALVLFSLAFSAWMMFKTFRGGEGGQLFVGSNNVFDFGLFIGLVRSMAWGGNIPLMSPFFAGSPLFYHFFFQFWVSLWEYAGIPTVYAVNIPSILSFSALLIIIYYLPQILLKKGKLAGWIAVLLTITHSTLTFWHLFIEKGLNTKLLIDIWRLPTYPFAGPFDGSTISLFTTLNSYVNQRHLAFASAIGLLLYMLVVKRLERKQLTTGVSLCIGFLTGLLFLWNMAICIIVGVLITFLFALHRSWKAFLFFLLGSSVLVLISLTQYIPYFIQTFTAVSRMVGGGYGTVRSVIPSWMFAQYLWENLGIFPFVMLLGFIVLSKKGKVFFLPFFFFFIIQCLLAGVGKRGFDQKFYSFLIIGVNVIVAVSIAWFWEKRTLVFRVAALGIFFVVSTSGVVDLMAIKNEFAFPLVNKETAPVIFWIRDHTPKNAVFVSYADIIDPVVLAGRKNYFGFFGNVGWTDRSSIVKEIYAGDIKTAKKLGISYILAPKWNKNDFPYLVDTMYFQEHRMVVYEDERYMILDIRQ
jgi:hypothetical protein